MTDRTKAILSLVLVFLVGTLFGGTLSYFLLKSATTRHDLWRFLSHTPPSGPTRLITQIAEALDLDAKQRIQLREKLEESHEQYKKTLRGFRKRFHEIRHLSRQQIRAILRPDQIPKFE